MTMLTSRPLSSNKILLLSPTLRVRYRLLSIGQQACVSIRMTTRLS
jgi:hypothetical protein